MSKSVWDMSDAEARQWAERNSAPNHVRQRNEDRDMDEARQRQIRMQRDSER